MPSIICPTTPRRANEIIEATQRIGGQGRQFGLMAQQVAALSATMIGLGKTPEVAGTGINALLVNLQTAEKGGKKFQAALE
jgi:TP901 family phage tail tape measure protein